MKNEAIQITKNQIHLTYLNFNDNHLLENIYLLIIYFELIWTDNDPYKNLIELNQKKIRYRFISSINQEKSFSKMLYFWF